MKRCRRASTNLGVLWTADSTQDFEPRRPDSFGLREWTRRLIKERIRPDVVHPLGASRQPCSAHVHCFSKILFQSAKHNAGPDVVFVSLRALTHLHIATPQIGPIVVSWAPAHLPSCPRGDGVGLARNDEGAVNLRSLGTPYDRV